jgi:hypothetical protein
MIADDHLEELRHLCPDMKAAAEAGIDYVLLPSLRMPAGCTPYATDCLLCLGSRDGYDNRLFFAQQVGSRAARNWNGQNIRILERNWFAFSWKVPPGLRAIETLLGHLTALR